MNRRSYLPATFRGPGLVFVADSGQWERVRRLVHCIREVQRSDVELYCINIGLSDAQAEALRLARVCPVKVIQGSRDAVPMRQPFLWKIFAHRFVPLAHPLIVCDTDIEFRAAGVLEELLRLAADRCFVAEEVFGWCSNLNVKFELGQIGLEKLAFLEPIWELLADGKILNAGLFGGPRPQVDAWMDHAMMLAGATLDVFHWFWEQIGLTVTAKMGAHDVAVLPTEYNWITSWGRNPKARIYHFSGETLANELRLPLPPAYLHVGDGRTAWCDRGGGVEVLA